MTPRSELTNAAKLSLQDPIDVAMTKLSGAPLQVATCLQDRVVNVTSKELQRELTINFSPLPYDSHASQTFANLIQGPEESLTLYIQMSNQPTHSDQPHI